MIPASFDYVRASSIDEAVDALQEHGDEAKLLAGGHSLLPLMKLRFAVPEVIVDLGRVAELRGVCEDGDMLAIGALTSHQAIVDDDLVKQHCGVLAEVARVIGDPQVRHRGTIGGALAHGDAAGDLPAVAVALDAQLVAQGPDGRRTIAAADFFQDYLTTALADDEVLVEIKVPKLDDTWRWSYQKFNRVAQAWAIVGSLGMVRRDNGTIADARVGLTNMASVPVRARAVEQAVTGSGADAIVEASQLAADEADPPSDLNADAEFRSHLARVLTRRALTTANG